MSDESDNEEIVPRKKKDEHQGPAKPTSIWMPVSLWDELKGVAKAEGYSAGEFTLMLIKAGYAAYKKQRAREVLNSEKP